jgi:hypothetical protein
MVALPVIIHFKAVKKKKKKKTPPQQQQQQHTHTHTLQKLKTQITVLFI